MPLSLATAVGFLVAAALFLLGGVVLLAGRRRAEGLVLTAFLALVGINFLDQALRPPGTRLGFLALALDPPLLLLFVMLFPFPRRGAADRVLLGLVAGAGVLAAAAVLLVPGVFLARLPGALPRPLEHALPIGVLVVGYLAAWLASCRSLREAPTPLLARRAAWTVLAVGITTVPRLALVPQDFGYVVTLPDPRLSFAAAAAVELGILLAVLGVGAAQVGHPRVAPARRALAAVAVVAVLLAALHIALEALLFGQRQRWGWPLAFGLRWIPFAGILAYGMLAYEIVAFRRASHAVFPPVGALLGGLAAFLATRLFLDAAGTEPAVALAVSCGTALAALGPTAGLVRWALRNAEDALGPDDAPHRRLALYRAVLESTWAAGAPTRGDRERLEAERRAFGVTPEEARAMEHVVAGKARPHAARLATGDEPAPGLVVERPLGEGAHGRVFLARRPAHGDRVVVKELRGGSPAILSELRAVRGIQHPHVVRLLDVHAAGGRVLLVLEHVEGETLASRLRRGPLTEPERLDVARGLLAALEAAHRAGVVHRDVKPANVLLDARGRPRLTDFGAASLRPDLARTLAALPRLDGTVAYMAPEQATGDAIDARTDVYAAGLVLYECVTGAPALDVQDLPLPQALRAVAAPRVDLAPLPPPWRRVLATALAPDPARRYASADEMRLALEHEHAPPHAEEGARVERRGHARS